MLDQLSHSRPLVLTILIGVLLVPLVILLNSYSPPVDKAPEGYNSVIIAFEFASNDQELLEVLSPLSLKEVNGLDTLNKMDFVFMLLYGAFLLSIVIKFKGLHQHPWLKYAAGIIFLIVAADFLENLQLLKLTEAYKAGASSYIDIINQLVVFTWLKWILLALVIGMIGTSLILANRYKWVGYALFIPIVLGVSAISIQTPMIEDTFGTSIFMCFMIIWLLSIFYKRTTA